MLNELPALYISALGRLRAFVRVVKKKKISSHHSTVESRYYTADSSDSKETTANVAPVRSFFPETWLWELIPTE